MSAAAMRWAIAQALPDGTLWALLKDLALMANTQGCATVSQDALALRSGLSERRVRSSLALLEQLGMITRQGRSCGRKGRLPDLIVLSLHRQFDLHKDDIRALRKTISNRTQRPVVSDVATGRKLLVGNNLQPDAASGCSKEKRNKRKIGKEEAGQEEGSPFPNRRSVDGEGSASGWPRVLH